nr:YggT family protein [Candidatus Gracilibacteria bacterium]
MINTIFIAIIIFTELLFYIVFIDVILSWVTLVGLNIRPKFIAQIIDPIYSFIKSFLPTTFGPFDFTPIILIMILYFIKGLIIILSPGVQSTINNYIK